MRNDPRRSIPNRRAIAALVSAAIAFLLISALAHETAADEKTPATQTATTDPAPDYSAYTQSYHLPFANLKPVDFDHLQSLQVRVSINGGPSIRLQVDTGSCGVIVSASDIPNANLNGPPGEMKYSSSGVELDGVWTLATITFLDSKDANGNSATATIPVLAATQRVFHPGAVNGGNRTATTAPVKNPKVYMLGIGTGRGTESHQKRNPWVNLKEMQAGTMRRGYTISRDGITLGLTADASKDFLFQKLNEHVGAPSTMPAVTTQPAPKDWDSSFGWISIDGQMQQKSWMLLDTGLTNLMIEYPQVKTISQVPDGTDITVGLLGGKLSYQFKTGDKANPRTPSKVSYVHREGVPMINTGLRALAHFDYLLDSDGGYFGLRPRAH